MSMRILFIDDDKTRLDQFVKNNPGQVVDWASTSSQALAILNSEKPPRYDCICFDHDLGVEDTTIPVARYIADNDNHFTDVIILIHSANPVGCLNIQSHLKYSGTRIFRIHFAWTIENLMDAIINQNCGE